VRKKLGTCNRRERERESMQAAAQAIQAGQASNAARECGGEH
jgi:hypothetical protein